MFQQTGHRFRCENHWIVTIKTIRMLIIILNEHHIILADFWSVKIKYKIKLHLNLHVILLYSQQKSELEMSTKIRIKISYRQ